MHKTKIMVLVSLNSSKNEEFSSSDTSMSLSDCTDTTGSTSSSCSIYNCQHQHVNERRCQHQQQQQQQQQHEQDGNDDALIISTGSTTGSGFNMKRIRRRKESNRKTTPAFTIQIQSQSKRIYKLSTILRQHQYMCSMIILLLLMIVQNEQQQQVTGFSTFLLTRSQCWTQLKENEIIMNQKIKSYLDTTDKDMIIKSFVASDGSISNESLLPHHLVQSNPNVVIVPQGFPSVLSLHVVTTNSNTHPDYQWVMDVIVFDEETKPKAHFVDGSCTNRVRVAGRGDETVSITIEHDGAQVIVGWANGYEAVKLTQIVTFVNSTTSPNIPNTDNIHDVVHPVIKEPTKSIKDIVHDKKNMEKNDPQKKLDKEFQKKYGIGAVHEQLVQFRDRAIKEKKQEERSTTDGDTESSSKNNHLDSSKNRHQHYHSNSDRHNQHFDRNRIQHKIIKRDMDGSIIDSTTNNNNHNKKMSKNNNNNMDDTFLHRQSITEQEERIKGSMLEDKISTNNNNNNDNNHNQNQNNQHNYNKYDNQNHPFRIEFANLFGERQQRERQQQNRINDKSGTGIQPQFGITSSSYFYGCIILILSMYCSIHICIWASKRTSSTCTSCTNSSIKGRLDL